MSTSQPDPIEAWSPEDLWALVCSVAYNLQTAVRMLEGIHFRLACKSGDVSVAMREAVRMYAATLRRCDPVAAAYGVAGDSRLVEGCMAGV